MNLLGFDGSAIAHPVEVAAIDLCCEIASTHHMGRCIAEYGHHCLVQSESGGPLGWWASERRSQHGFEDHDLALEF
jgi:hypothetical protein